MGVEVNGEVASSRMRNFHEPARGYVPLLVGSEQSNGRFLIRTRLLSHPFILSLLEIAAQEYGYNQHGILKIPCDVEHFREVVDRISK